MADNEGKQTEATATPGSAAYPWQLIIVVALFIVFIAFYIYFTAGEDQGVTTDTRGTQTEQTME